MDSTSSIVRGSDVGEAKVVKQGLGLTMPDLARVCIGSMDQASAVVGG